MAWGCLFRGGDDWYHCCDHLAVHWEVGVSVRTCGSRSDNVKLNSTRIIFFGTPKTMWAPYKLRT